MTMHSFPHVHYRCEQRDMKSKRCTHAHARRKLKVLQPEQPEAAQTRKEEYKDSSNDTVPQQLKLVKHVAVFFPLRFNFLANMLVQCGRDDQDAIEMKIEEADRLPGLNRACDSFTSQSLPAFGTILGMSGTQAARQCAGTDSRCCTWLDAATAALSRDAQKLRQKKT
jgi:hypothetical protein